jgi:hypothetical protein
MTIKAHFEGALGYFRKRETYVLRIESDKFKICEPKEVRSQKYLLAERTFIVHVPKKGKIRIEPLN